jgi:CubicO group peptidase (beta-lactamase class C family)
MTVSCACSDVVSPNITPAAPTLASAHCMMDRRTTLKLLAAASVGWPIRASSQSSFAMLDANLKKAVAAGYAPGLVGLVALGAEVHVASLGRMAAGGAAMQRDSIFRIASMTKPITAAATMMLVDEGKLDLQAPVDTLLPELANRRVLRMLDGPVDATEPARRRITLEDLLTFRLGWGLILQPPGTYPIQKLIDQLGIVGFGPPDPHMPYNNDEWMKRLSTLPLFAQPGERWMYTTGSNILGVLIARASRMSFGDFLAERIFKPLGMKDSGFYVPQANIGRLVTAYRPKGTGLEVWDEPTSGGWSRPPAFEQGDGGLVSTVDDYLAFARLLLGRGDYNGRRLLSTQAVQLMTTDHLTPAQRADGVMVLQEGHGWGYGMSVVVAANATGAPSDTIGWSGGFGTKWQTDPAAGLTTILMTPSMFYSPKPAPVFETFEKDARRS